MENFSWSQYWSDKTNGGHRSQDEDFLKKEAQEKFFHLAGGKSLLDFGCGSGDILIYLIPHYEQVTGADFSASMLEKAQEKITICGYMNVKLIQANDVTIWEKIDRPYDRIINVQVIQHFTIDQIEKFIVNASKKLSPDGKIIFFDVIDSRLFDFWRAGLFSKNFNYYLVFLRYFKLKLTHFIRGGPNDKIMGYSYDSNIIESIAQKNGFHMESVKSMYYEYRYHVILTKTSN